MSDNPEEKQDQNTTITRTATKVVDIGQTPKPLAKIDRTVALVHSVNGEYSAQKFSIMLRDEDPTVFGRHGDGRVAAATWFHTDPGEASWASTVFNSFRELQLSYTEGMLQPNGNWVGPAKLAAEGGIRVATGKYMGEDGVWFLFRGGPVRVDPPYAVPPLQSDGK